MFHDFPMTRSEGTENVQRQKISATIFHPHNHGGQFIASIIAPQLPNQREMRCVDVEGENERSGGEKVDTCEIRTHACNAQPLSRRSR